MQTQSAVRVCFELATDGIQLCLRQLGQDTPQANLAELDLPSPAAYPRTTDSANVTVSLAQYFTVPGRRVGETMTAGPGGRGDAAELAEALAVMYIHIDDLSPNSK